MLGYRLIDGILFGSHPLAPPLQRVVQRMIGGPRAASFALDGREFQCTTAHKYYFERANYERDLWPVILQCINRRSVVYDVGAHFGFWALRLAQRVRRVYAFEPSESNLVYLRRNCGFPNVTIVPAAAGAKAGITAFCDAGSMSRVGEGTQQAPMTTVDAFAVEHEPADLILMDVEGHGGEVLKGAKVTLVSTQPKILFECHNPKEDEVATTVLRDCGYTLRSLSAGRSYPFRLIAVKSPAPPSVSNR